jgi:SAM-dependent methyltransferase
MAAKQRPADAGSRLRYFVLLASIPCAFLTLRVHTDALTTAPFSQRYQRDRTVRQCASSWRKPATAGAADDYQMPAGYKTNPVLYFNDLTKMDLVWQPDVYNYAAHFAALTGSWIIDVGSGTGLKSARIYQESRTGQRFVELDFGPNLAVAKRAFESTDRYNATAGGGVVFEEWDISSDQFPEVGLETLRGATIVSSDVIEHLSNPDQLVDGLLSLLHGCRADNLIISTINRRDNGGPRNNAHHIREWTTAELERYLTSRGASVQSCILTYSNNKDKDCCPEKMQTSVCLISRRHAAFPPLAAVHDHFPFKAAA